MNNSSISNLSFVKCLQSGKHALWTPDRPESYSAACDLGRSYAEELLAFMQDNGDPAIFGAVLRAIVRAGIWGPVEIGFCSAFGVVLAGIQPRPRYASTEDVTAVAA